MTLDEAIKHAEEVAEENSKSYEEWLACKNRGNVGWSKSDIEAVDKSIEQCKKCAEEHRQLAEWLKDYKRLKEQQSCEDVVSRQAALNSLMDNTHLEGYDLSEALDAIESTDKLPPVTPQQKVGRWITRKDRYGDIYEAVCSCCGINGNHKWTYCPNCGCKMSEV